MIRQYVVLSRFRVYTEFINAIVAYLSAESETKNERVQLMKWNMIIEHRSAGGDDDEWRRNV